MANRGASIRIPRDAEKAGRGYMEARTWVGQTSQVTRRTDALLPIATRTEPAGQIGVGRD